MVGVAGKSHQERIADLHRTLDRRCTLRSCAGVAVCRWMYRVYCYGTPHGSRNRRGLSGRRCAILAGLRPGYGCGYVVLDALPWQSFLLSSARSRKPTPGTQRTSKGTGRPRAAVRSADSAAETRGWTPREPNSLIVEASGAPSFQPLGRYTFQDWRKELCQ
jgi:hypothetical protein